MLCLSSWDNIVQEYCILSVVQTSETTLHKEITCAILALSTQVCFCRNITYAMLSWLGPMLLKTINPHHVDCVGPQFSVLSILSKYGWDNIAQKNYWSNVGPDHIFLKENNHTLSTEKQYTYNCVLIYLGQCCLRKLPVEFWPMFLRKKKNL